MVCDVTRPHRCVDKISGFLLFKFFLFGYIIFFFLDILKRKFFMCFCITYLVGNFVYCNFMVRFGFSIGFINIFDNYLDLRRTIYMNCQIIYSNLTCRVGI